MSSRDNILKSIREHTKTRYEMPDLNAVNPTAYSDKIMQFCEIMKQVGGEAVLLKENENINDVIRSLNPDVSRIASALPEITCATFNPDDLSSPAELNGTDVAVIKGRLGVAENGAVWIEQDVKHRALYFISEKLVILLEKQELVNNMEEAYRQINVGQDGFGTFISGPSKTADIEQALVFGAHGAKGVTVVLI